MLTNKTKKFALCAALAAMTAVSAFGITACEAGVDGKDGIGIANVQINADGELILTYTDGTEKNVGKVVGEDGVDGAKGDKGDKGDKGPQGATGKPGATGATGPQGPQGADGKDGVGIANVAINENGELVITYTDGTEKNVGKVVGEDGESPYIGENGNWWVGETDTGVSAKFTGDAVKEYVFKEATCTEYGWKVLEDANGNYKIERINKGHEYEAEWTWTTADTVDGVTAKVTVTCKHDASDTHEYTLSVNADDEALKGVKELSRENASCVAPGSVTYQAYYTFQLAEGETTQDGATKVTFSNDSPAHELTQLEHDFAEQDWEKNEAYAYIDCNREGCETILVDLPTEAYTEDKDEVTVGDYKWSYAVTTAPDCENVGKGTYTLKDSRLPALTHEVEIAALGHDYSIAVDWTGTTKDKAVIASVTYTCANSDCASEVAIEEYNAEADPAQTISYSVGDAPIYTAATHESPAKYTWQLTVNGITDKDGFTFVAEYFVEEGDALGHEYTYVIDTKPTEDTAGQATVSCAKEGDHTDGETLSKVVALAALTDETFWTKATTPVTCEEDGKDVYTHTEEINGYQVTITVEVIHESVGHVYGEWVKTSDGRWIIKCQLEPSHFVVVKSDEMPTEKPAAE